MRRFEVSSRVDAPEDLVWARVTAPDGFNDELMPIVRMTVPRAMRGKTIADVTPGERFGRSWLLLFGFLPFDYDDIGIAELGPGSRFLERSSMLTMREWEHERTVTPQGTVCDVTDRIGFTPRLVLRPLGPVLRAVYRQVFLHRHRRLRRYFA